MRRPVTGRRVQIHWSFLMLALVMTALGQAVNFAMLVASVTLHELAHVTVLKICGGRVKQLRFMALGEVAAVAGLEEMNAYRRYAVFFAGPAVSIFIGGFAFIWGWMDLSAFNLLVGFFNLIPVFPLDGGRILQLFLSNRLGILRSDRLLTRLGRLAGNALMAAGIIYAVLYPCDISLLCVGMYIRQWNKQTLIPLTMEFYSMIARKPEIKKGVVPIRLCAVYSDTPICDLVERISWDKTTHALIDDLPANLLREDEFMDYVLDNGLNGTVGNVWDAVNRRGTGEEC